MKFKSLRPGATVIIREGLKSPVLPFYLYENDYNAISTIGIPLYMIVKKDRLFSNEVILLHRMKTG